MVFKHLGALLSYLADSFLQQNVDGNANPQVKTEFLWLSPILSRCSYTRGQVRPLASVFWGFGNTSLKTTVVEHQGLGLTRGGVTTFYDSLQATTGLQGKPATVVLPPSTQGPRLGYCGTQKDQPPTG